MTFDITAGPRLMPLKVVLYGSEGIGKSTFASHFPNPLFSYTFYAKLFFGISGIELRNIKILLSESREEESRRQMKEHRES